MAMSLVNASEIIQTLTPLVEVLERFGIKDYMSGSMASSVHGKGRYAQEVDVVAALQFKRVRTLVLLLQQAYSVDADMNRDAIKTSRCFDCCIRTPVCPLTYVPSKSYDGQGRKYWKWEAVPFSMPLLQDMILARSDWGKLGL